MSEQLVFQLEDRGSIPTSPLQCKITPCSFSDIREIFRQFHYKGDHIGGGISECLGLKYDYSFVAGSVLGKLRHDSSYSSTNNKCIEIRRMACLDSAPKNTESYFLSKIIWYLKKNTDIDNIISYSDKSVGHLGTIYKAANFQLIKETAPTKHVYWKGVRYHPRSLTIDRPYSYALREAVKNKEAIITIEQPKLVYSYKIKR